jgi:hypothetical protein
MSSIRSLPFEEVAKLSAFYQRTIPLAEFDVIDHHGYPLKRGFDLFLDAYVWAVEYQRWHTEDRVDVLIRIPETVTSTLQLIDAA